MATTYNKPLKTIVVKTIGGATINASDTATDPIASDALRDFEARGIMHIRKSGGETLVPFHAVDNIDVTASVTEVTRADAYCAEESDSEGGEGEGNGEGNGEG